jgi:hypothetical protein
MMPSFTPLGHLTREASKASAIAGCERYLPLGHPSGIARARRSGAPSGRAVPGESRWARPFRNRHIVRYAG